MLNKLSTNLGVLNPNLSENPLGLEGVEFLEYSSPNPAALEKVFLNLGFEKVGKHKKMDIDLYRQGGINFLINKTKNTFASKFSQQHGGCICASGWRVKNAKKAYDLAVERGAKPYTEKGHRFLAIYGIGDSLVYFVDEHQKGDFYFEDFEKIKADSKKGVGLKKIDHLTNNVPKGEMEQWCEFYDSVFGFKMTRFFDIKGQQTGLVSKVMSSPGYHIVIPINEPTGEKSQIQEYLDEYKGSGIQHIALTTDDIVKTVKDLKAQGVEFLDAPDSYYEALKKRLPNVEEDLKALQELKILVDGDHEGYLLQIFTKNQIGPIFYEIIQRKKHEGFGEGNFQALFDAIEEDQRRRGYLN